MSSSVPGDYQGCMLHSMGHIPTRMGRKDHHPHPMVIAPKKKSLSLAKMISLKCRERRSSWCWLNSQCHKAEAGRGWRDKLEPELTRTCLWLPGEGDPHSGTTTSCEEKHLSKVHQECPSVSLALLGEALVAPKGPQVMWADGYLSVGSRLAVAQAAPGFPLCFRRCLVLWAILPW